jgi:hypothetical protein
VRGVKTKTRTTKNSLKLTKKLPSDANPPLHIYHLKYIQEGSFINKDEIPCHGIWHSPVQTCKSKIKTTEKSLKIANKLPSDAQTPLHI